MNLAIPAPQVEAAVAVPPIVEHVEPATASMVRPSNSMITNIVQPPPIVEPAEINISNDDKNITLVPSQQQQQTQQLLVPPPLSVDGLRLASTTTTTTTAAAAAAANKNNNFFESYVAILPRAPPKNIFQILLPCLYDDRPFVTYGEVKKYCFIQCETGICYVYNDRTDLQPLYQISLLQPGKDLSVVMEDRYCPHRNSTTISPEPNTNLSRPEMQTVLLFQQQRLLLYQFTFDTTTHDSTVANRFLSIVQSIITK